MPSNHAAIHGQVVDVRRFGRVHHVAVVVRDLEASLGFYRDVLGLPLDLVQDVASDHVRIAFLTVGESKIELVSPTDETTGVARFLASKGEGFHHVCLEVGDLAAELTRLGIEGFHHVCLEVGDLAAELTRLGIEGVELIDSAPRHGAEGPVAFIHPRSCHGVLVELIEAPGGPAWRSLGFARR